MKPWLILGLTSSGKDVILCECETLEFRIDFKFISKIFRFKISYILWTIKEYFNEWF